MAQDDHHDNFVEILGSERGESHQNMRMIGRKEKRKALKKLKRKQMRKEIAICEREEEEARLNDAEEQMRLGQLEQEEVERMERDRKKFEESERKFLKDIERKKEIEDEEIEQQKLLEESQFNQIGNRESNELKEGDEEWDYVEEGPIEIIWQGNEIIVKKKKIRVPKKDVAAKNLEEDIGRPISNPLAPQSEAFDVYKSAQELLDSAAQQVPNFGTEQDKAHCPFHLKTGVCRFGTRCSRFHFYPDKSCTLLMKNMYNGPGLSWEQDEGLEHTDEEVEHCFEEFYEDVHTEFLKFGEIVNFKVCNNGCYHLRGNVYVHYKSVESALLAYHSINGRYFAGKQVICEFVNITRWKVAICGEYMKSRLKSCSRGSACNFIHCFRNPGGDYEWADWDKPPPRYWVNKMAALFGHTDVYDDEVSPWKLRKSIKRTACNDFSSIGRSRSQDLDKIYGDEDDHWKVKRQGRHTRTETINTLDLEIREERIGSKEHHQAKCGSHVACSDVDQSDWVQDDDKSSATRRSRSRSRNKDLELTKAGSKKRDHLPDADRVLAFKNTDGCCENKCSSSRRRKRPTDLIHESRDETRDFDFKSDRDDYAHSGGRPSNRSDDLDRSDMHIRKYAREAHNGHGVESQRRQMNEAESYNDLSSGLTVDKNEKRHSKCVTKDSHKRSSKKFFHNSDDESVGGSSDRGEEKHTRERNTGI